MSHETESSVSPIFCASSLSCQFTNICSGHTDSRHNRPGARFNKEVQPTLSLNLNSELSYSEMGNSEFSVTEQLNCVSLLNSK